MRSNRTLIAAAVVASLTVYGTARAASFSTRADDKVAASARQLATGFAAPLQPMVEALYRDGEWNAVLNFEQLGLAAMELGDGELAKKAFDAAIARIDAIYADDDNARKAKSVFSEEKVKDFKGEPYERAMAYFYRGLLYAADGDFQNARAAFLAADRQDTMSEQETFSGDFGMMKYLAGWASYCDGDAERGRTLTAQAKTSDTTIAWLPDELKSDIVLIDTGTAPTKVGTGKHKEFLTFSRGAVTAVPDKFDDGNAPAFKPVANVYFQASTRGGRPVDGILNGKAQFKDGAKEVGQVATQVGEAATIAGIASGNRGMAGAGLIGLFVGLVADGIAASTTPAADVRYWSSLPDSIAMRTGMLPVADVSGGNVAGAKAMPIASKIDHCRIVWARTHSALPVEFGGTAKISKEAAAEEGRETRNQLFRAMLEAELRSATPAVTASTTPSAQ